MVFLFSVNVPAFAKDAVQYTSNATTALSIICVGYMLSTAKFGVIFKKWRISVTAIIQLILGPLVTFLLLTAVQYIAKTGLGIDFPNEVIVVCTLIEALPTATSLGLKPRSSSQFPRFFQLLLCQSWLAYCLAA